MMKSIHALASASLLLIAATACSPDLVVENLSNPDIARVFSTPASIEATIGSGYQQIHNSLTNQALWPEVQMLGLETFSSLNNFNMGLRSNIPRTPIANANGSPTIFSEFSSLSKQSRLMVNALDAHAVLNKAGVSLGTVAQDKRARAMGFFGAGSALGWLALIYDSAGVVGTGMPSDSIPPLSGAQDVMKAAIVMLDSAYLYAADPLTNGTGGLPLPATWAGNNALTQDQFKRLIRSQRARFRAGVARVPAQRAAVDWAKVIDDAENGLTADFLVSVGGTTGWNLGDITQIYVDPGWGQMSMLYSGMADVSGAYAAYIAKPIDQRDGNFLVVTPDKRWPQGATRAAQQAASVQPVSTASKPYVSNRSAPDVTGPQWGISWYDFYRFKYIKNSQNQGLYPEFMKNEVDMLAAEGYIRTGNIAAAAAKIDLTRVPNGLPALAGAVTSATQAIPGGAQCVPQVPNGSTVSCGTILEAMKYEKRLETAYSSFGRWWIDGRGWGDLVANTAWEYPIPYQEMQSRQKPYYAAGGGNVSSAAKGTYGF